MHINHIQTLSFFEEKKGFTVLWGKMTVKALPCRFVSKSLKFDFSYFQNNKKQHSVILECITTSARVITNVTLLGFSASNKANTLS